MKNFFNLFDINKSGAISIKELKMAIRNLGVIANNEQIKKLMKLMDKVI